MKKECDTCNGVGQIACEGCCEDCGSGCDNTYECTKCDGSGEVEDDGI